MSVISSSLLFRTPCSSLFATDVPFTYLCKSSVKWDTIYTCFCRSSFTVCSCSIRSSYSYFSFSNASNISVRLFCNSCTSFTKLLLISRYRLREISKSWALLVSSSYWSSTAVMSLFTDFSWSFKSMFSRSVNSRSGFVFVSTWQTFFLLIST